MKMLSATFLLPVVKGCVTIRVNISIATIPGFITSNVVLLVNLKIKTSLIYVIRIYIRYLHVVIYARIRSKRFS